MEAARSSDWNEEEAVARWRRVAELGTEAGLREVGCPEQTIAETLQRLHASRDPDNLFVENLTYIFSSLSGTENAAAVLLATLGRGITSHLKKLKFERHIILTRSGVGHSLRNWHELTALGVNMSSNTNVQELVLSRNSGIGDPAGLALLTTPLKSNSSIQYLNLRNCNLKEEGVRCLMEALKANKTLAHLDLSANSLGSGGFESIGEFLSTNNNLKCLDLSSTGCEGQLYPLASALARNTTLEDLSLSGNRVSSHDLEQLLAPLSCNLAEPTSASKSPENITLKRLDLSNLSMEPPMSPFPVEPVARMIRTNRNLLKLAIGKTYLSAQEWTGQLLAALRENETLEELDLSDCMGMSDDVFLDLRRGLRFFAIGLRKINLKGSDIGFRQGLVDEEIRVNIEYRGQLRGQPRVETTAGRLVLCGYEYAGKTAIRKTMERIEHGMPCFHPWSVCWRKVMEAAPGLRSFLFGRDAHLEQTARTRGVDILVLHKQQYLASVWDFAGQREYYALHDYLFPNVINSCYLYVCSCRCPPDLQNRQGNVKDQSSMRAECEYWMRFIASNSKSRQHGLPHVRFVLTHKDTVDSDTLNTSRQHAEDVVAELRRKFQGVIELCETVEVVNARSSEDVERLITLTNSSLKEILEHQTEYAVCKAVRSATETWSANNRSKPVLSLTEFQDIWTNQVGASEKLAFKDASLETVLAFLNDIGDLIFFKGLDFIVANPRWFGVGVLGSLIDAIGWLEDFHQPGESRCAAVLARPKHFWKLHHNEGFVERRNIKRLLNHSLQTMNLRHIIPADKLIQLMIHLELCFETEPGNAESPLFIPALFDDETDSAAKGRRKIEWKLARADPLYYLGRRLECEDKSLTFLTPGFFPRLQVHLRNYIHERNWTANSGFEVGRNLICFAENGVEVCVEYSGDIDYFVDILVRSSKPYAVALQFIEEHVVNKIVQFCASPQGCQGVLLVEAVIRPACVKGLHLCVNRKVHSVLVSDLRARIATDDAYEYTWSHKIEDVKDTDFAAELLEGEGRSSRACNFSHSDEWSSSVERQLPTLFYPSIEGVGLLRKLDQWLNVTKVMPIKLHLMCDHKDGSHKVEGQPGRTMRLKWKANSYELPLAKYALTLLWGGVAVGSGIAGARVVSSAVDTWIQDLFSVPEMPEISAETLHQLMSKGESRMPVSQQEILQALNRYMKIDPHTQGLKKILNLQDGDKFWKDFRLRKVIYTHQNKVGWVCERHYRSGLLQEDLKSCPLV